MRSLLVIKPSSLGDIVHGLQVLQGVARQLPDCRITWVVRDRFAGLVEAAPFVAEVIPYRRKAGISGLWEILRTLRRREFDVVWDMQGLLRSALMLAAARSTRKWGRHDSREGARWFYPNRVAMPAGPGPHHAIPVLQQFPVAMGIDPSVQIPLLLKTGPACPWAEFFSGNDPDRNFVIFTDSRGVAKEWHGFEALTRMIWERIPDSRVAWCAGNPAVPGIEPPAGRFLNLTGCPLDEMIELCRQPSVFIGNDSGPMHLSAAVGNKVLAIFGPTSPLRFGPWPLDSPRTCAVQAPGGILTDLTAETVCQALQHLLAGTGNRAS